MKIHNLILYWVLFYTLLSFIDRYVEGSFYIQYLVYAIEFGLILYVFSLVLKNSKFIKSLDFQVSTLFVLSLLPSVIINLSGFQHSVKFAGYAVFFLGMSALVKRKGITDIRLLLDRKIVYSLCFIPLIIVSITGNYGYDIFPNSNVFVYYGIIVSGLYYEYSKKLSISLFILLAYILLGKTVGIVFALSVALLMFYREQLSFKAVFSFGIFASVLILIIFYTDILIAIRIRSIFNILTQIDYTELKNPSSVSYGELMKQSISGRGDDVSFLFRLKHWANILDLWQNSPLHLKIFGHGEGSLFVDTYFERAAHNDYLRFLYEYGLLSLMFVISIFFMIAKSLKRNTFKIFFLAAVIYYLTENLCTNFPATSLLFLILGFQYGAMQNKVSYGDYS